MINKLSEALSSNVKTWKQAAASLEMLGKVEVGQKKEGQLQGHGLRVRKWVGWVLELGLFEKGQLTQGLWLDEFGYLTSGQFKENELAEGGMLYSFGQVFFGSWDYNTG